MKQYLIRRVRLAHCKRGPDRCDQCREMDAERICLLDIRPEGEMQRRVIQVGEIWYEFEILRSFENKDEARSYAEEHGIDDVEI